MNVVYAMKYLMRVSNVQDVHFYVVQGVLIIINLLIIIIVLFVDIKKSTVLYIWLSIINIKAINRVKNTIITESKKKVYFGASGYSDFTIHKDEARKQRYINRHKKNEVWSKSGIDTAGFWSRWLLWNLPSIKASYEDIKRKFNI